MNLFSKLYNWISGSRPQRLKWHCDRERKPAGRRRPLQRAAELFLDAKGKIQHLRIGSWRVISASNTREIAEIRELPGCDRLAVRIELSDRHSLQSTCTIWELYDSQGHLHATLQSTPEPGFWLATDFQSGQIRRSRAEVAIGLSA